MKKTIIVGLVVLLALAAAYIFRSRFHHETVRPTSSDSACLGNLRQLFAAEQEWALENHKTTNDTPTWNDLRNYLSRGEILRCPQGGTYTLGSIGGVLTCSIGGPGHTLP